MHSRSTSGLLSASLAEKQTAGWAPTCVRFGPCVHVGQKEQEHKVEVFRVHTVSEKIERVGHCPWC